ncbi:hypothetical protein SMACR_08671 [Sordaria macrospora]|uniref:WGS project CABT00000000 data, contig 2.63 n=2 Tax=Sordaria macrospora TaxID=5147 RepID=F7WAL7_SORMK|nr:uncharacterized protein SMAC_08671 [Sordaria macrospora k-hell]KAA8629557.1 hypothetical protein SMACR_08671 [Sordaria macrospora]WPJ67306.1 hypothetical protein SMAC4_08671 [Sordaria macrospora]CCC14212.1 unnamed protein product [Sordaria macrospora k-hell]
MARIKRTLRLSPREVLRRTPWATPHIWDAADLPAQLAPESDRSPGPVYNLEQQELGPNEYMITSYRDHDDIWLPSFFAELMEDHNQISGLQMEGVFRGRWVRDRKLRKPAWGFPERPWQSWNWRMPLRSQGSPPEPLSLPQDYVMQAYPLGHEDSICAADLDMIDVPNATFNPCPGGRGMLDKLPVEVLEMIIEYLVPTGCTYNFFMAEMRDVHSEFRSIRYVVHQMVPIWTPKELDKLDERLDKEEVDACEDTDEMDFPDGEGDEEKEIAKRSKTAIQGGSAHMALACINKTFQDLIYARFYGGNTFIFHLSSYPFTPINIEARDLDTRWTSWTRVLTRNVRPRVVTRNTARPPGPLGPITARAARYITDIKFSIVTPYEDTTDEEAMGHLAQAVDSAVSLLLLTPTDASPEEQEKRRQPSVSLHLQFSSPHASMDDNIVTLQAGFNRVTEKIYVGPGTWSGIQGRLDQTPAENKLDLMMQPLWKLRGLIKDMCVHGYEIPMDFLDEVGLVCVDKEVPPSTICYTYHNQTTCECIKNGARECPRKRLLSGVPTPRWQLEGLGWTFFRGAERLKERNTRDDTTTSHSAATKATGTKPPIYIPSAYDKGPWSP